MELAIASVIRKGTLWRYATTGIFNGLVFWILWEIFRLFSDGSDLQENTSWAVAWTFSSALAFFTHNKFTFNSEGDLKKMFFATFLTYMITVVCSTSTYDFFVDLYEYTRIVGFLNLLIWGIIDWAILRWMIFRHVDESISSAKEPTEKASFS